MKTVNSLYFVSANSNGNKNTKMQLLTGTLK